MPSIKLEWAIFKDKMAGEGGIGVLGLKCFIILCIIVRLHALRDASTHKLTIQEKHEQSTGSQLLSYYKLEGFNGYFLLNATGRKVANGSWYTGTTLLNKPRLGHITQIIFVALARAGDIESQPGPSSANAPTDKKRKYEMKFKCQICYKGIRMRPVACYSCKQISHAKCIEGLSPELYDKYKVNMEAIPHICKFCNNSNDCINVNIPVHEAVLEPTSDPSPSPLTQAPQHTLPHPRSVPASVVVTEEERVGVAAHSQRSHSTQLPPDDTRILHCQYCDDNFKIRKTK